MAKSKDRKQSPGLFGKGQRYWSVMLVGEHGHVIPFRRFKEIALTVTALAVLSSLALVVLGILYYHQSRTIERLRTELQQWQHQAKQLKDEKDVLKAQVVIRSLQNKEAAGETSPKPDLKADAAPGPKAQNAEAGDKKETPVQREAAPAKPSVKWRADIRQFDIHFDARAELLKARFRIYNVSTPKKPLSGHIVTVFKAGDDPPSKWTVVPKVPLSNGKPKGQSGKAFGVRNYRTMEFKATGQKAPVAFDTVTVYVFSKDGQMILSRDFDIDVPYTPPAPAAPAEKKPDEENVSADTSPAPAEATDDTPTVNSGQEETGSGSSLGSGGSSPDTRLETSAGQASDQPGQITPEGESSSEK